MSGKSLTPTELTAKERKAAEKNLEMLKAAQRRMERAANADRGYSFLIDYQLADAATSRKAAAYAALEAAITEIDRLLHEGHVGYEWKTYSNFWNGGQADGK